MRTAVFPGSFDPFTVGHADIASRALQLFDRVVIAVGHNAQKPYGTPVGERLAAIERWISTAFPEAEARRLQVVSYTGLTADLAQRLGARFLVRGVRSVNDFEYEREMAAVNAHLTATAEALETVILIADPRHAHISSSLVRELQSYGRDITPYLP